MEAISKWQDSTGDTLRELGRSVQTIPQDVSNFKYYENLREKIMHSWTKKTRLCLTSGKYMNKEDIQVHNVCCYCFKSVSNTIMIATFLLTQVDMVLKLSYL